MQPPPGVTGEKEQTMVLKADAGDGAGSGAQTPDGASPDLVEALGAPVDTGANVPTGATQAASPAPAAPATPAKAESIPMKRFEQVVAQKNQATTELQEMKVAQARSESDAQAWRALNADPAKAAAVSRILSGEAPPVQPAPMTTSVRPTDFDDDPAKAIETLVQETAQRIRAESAQEIADLRAGQAQTNQYLMGILGEVQQNKAQTQRAQLQEAFPDEYDSDAHDTLIATMMNGNQNLTVAQAFLLVKSDPSFVASEKGGDSRTAEGGSPNPTEVVEAPSGVPNAAAQNASNELNRLVASGASEEAITAALHKAAVASGEIQRFVQGG